MKSTNPSSSLHRGKQQQEQKQKQQLGRRRHLLLQQQPGQNAEKSTELPPSALVSDQNPNDDPFHNPSQSRAKQWATTACAPEPRSLLLSPKTAAASARTRAIRLKQEKQRPLKQNNVPLNRSNYRIPQTATRMSTGRHHFEELRVAKGRACNPPNNNGVKTPKMSVVGKFDSSGTSNKRSKGIPAPSCGTLTRSSDLQRVVVPGAVAVDGLSDTTTLHAHSDAILGETAGTSNGDSCNNNDDEPQAIGAYLVDDSGHLAANTAAEQGEAIEEGGNKFVAATEVVKMKEATTAAAPADRKWRRSKLFVIYCVAVLLPSAILSTVIGVIWGGEKAGQSGTVVSAPPPSSQVFWSDDDSVRVQATTANQQTSPNDARNHTACVEGWYYYTYESGTRIGAVDVSSSATNQYISTPDCPLYYLTFDQAGTAYGHCYFGDLNSTLVVVDLASGETTALAEFPQYPPMARYYDGLAFNRANGYFYTTVRLFPQPTMQLVQIDGKKPQLDIYEHWLLIGSYPAWFCN